MDTTKAPTPLNTPFKDFRTLRMAKVLIPSPWYCHVELLLRIPANGSTSQDRGSSSSFSQALHAHACTNFARIPYSNHRVCLSSMSVARARLRLGTPTRLLREAPLEPRILNARSKNGKNWTRGPIKSSWVEEACAAWKRGPSGRGQTAALVDRPRLPVSTC